MTEGGGDAGVGALDAAACLFRALGDPSRLTILQHLALGEHRVVDLTAHLGLAQSTVSKHLACLRDCGLVESRTEGRSSLFRVTHLGAISDVLTAAEQLLELTEDAPTHCPTTGTTARGTTTDGTTTGTTTADDGAPATSTSSTDPAALATDVR